MNINWWVAITFIVAGIISFLGGFMLSRISIRRTIHELAQAAKRYSKGNLSEKISFKMDSQFGELIRAMNSVAVVLKNRISETENEKIKLTAVLDNIAEGIIAVDRNKEIVMMNPAAEAILGYPRNSAKGKNLIEVVQNPVLDGMMEQAIQNSVVLSREITLSGNNEPRILKANMIGISKSENAICGILVLYDVTEIRRLENTRREFVANVSHELRTPLTSIRGFIETLMGGALQDPARSTQFLKIMEEDTKRLTRLIDDLLELSKIESREIELRLEPVALPDEIENVIHSFQPLLKQKQINIQNRIAQKNFPKVLADRDKLRQVFVNLLDNAIKFNHQEGEIVIDAELEIQNSILKVSLQDTGIGIPESAIPRIFERFYRVDKARTRESGGTGLGLAIAKHIVEAHGGTIACESIPGQGSRFILSLKLAS